VQVFYATEADFEAALGRYERSVSEVLDDLLFRLEQPGLTATEKERGIILLVDTVLRYAYLNGASDVHLDPVEKGAVLRYRIDGVLHDVYRLDGAFVELVVSRIKILAKMRTDEHRSAQDGKLSFVVEGRSSCRSDQKKIDVRASVIPTAYGENVVMRLLTADNRSLALDDLGFSLDDSRKVNAAIRKSIGMILVTGPTGSGKTTTLYGILKLLNRREVNIATIEDPIEYSIEGITQIQVNPKTNLTFADGLRAIVRQDPNIIMVGEIRDHETADSAVNSAMTGHLVLSTLHTNNAAIALPRLLDMGIEPFLLSSTIDIIIAQRLVRKICTSCKTAYKPEHAEMKLLGIRDNQLLYKGKGCSSCNNTGYRDRTAIHEIMPISKELRELIDKKASIDHIRSAAFKHGTMALRDNCMQMVLKGTTTVEEMLKVTYSIE
jgi:type IV pilus assembly protein PilB